MDNSIDNTGIRLLSDLSNSDGAAMTFERVIQQIRAATDSIDMHMFVWRNDDIGNRIGREILAAADRGVNVQIRKDIGAFMYERIEMNRKSFFNVTISPVKRLIYKINALTFPDTYVEDAYDDGLGKQVMSHSNVAIEWVDHTHTKYYIFDRQWMITGSINIEDRHREYRDYMVELSGEELVERFHLRNRGAVAFDAGRSLDFVLNATIDGKQKFEIKPAMLELMSAARRSLYIEMAYIGDPEISRKIIEVANRGVKVTTLFSKAANIGNDINYRSLLRICRQAEIVVYLSDKMIHSKLMLIDEETVILGSANTSVFSMQKAVEMDIVVKDKPEFIDSVRKTVAQRVSQGHKVSSIGELQNYNKLIASLQQIHQFLN